MKKLGRFCLIDYDRHSNEISIYTEQMEMYPYKLCQDHFIFILIFDFNANKMTQLGHSFWILMKYINTRKFFYNHNLMESDMEIKGWYAWINLMPPKLDDFHVIGDVFVSIPE